MAVARGKPGLYAIRNLVTATIYYGSTRNLSMRRSKHWHALKRGNHGNMRLQSSWNKHGEGAFEFVVLAVLEPSEVLATEQRLLDQVVGIKGCCNIARNARASTLGLKLSPESRAKIGNALRGRKKSPEAVENMRLAHTGNVWTPERRARSSVARKGQPRMGSPAAWRHSAETRAKLSAAKKGKPLTAEHRERIGASLLGRKRQPHSDETKAKISAAQKRRFAITSLTPALS